MLEIEVFGKVLRHVATTADQNHAHRNPGLSRLKFTYLTVGHSARNASRAVLENYDKIQGEELFTILNRSQLRKIWERFSRTAEQGTENIPHA
jgi:hypothetical protein